MSDVESVIQSCVTNIADVDKEELEARARVNNFINFKLF